MLTRSFCVLLAFFLVSSVMGSVGQPQALGEDGCAGSVVNEDDSYGGTITVSVECGGSGGAEGSGGGGATGCVNSAGEAIPCFLDGYPYQPAMNMYCHLVDLSHISPKALWWQCLVLVGPFLKDWWIPAGPIPTAADELAHEAAATLTLHPATVNIGAWEKKEWPGYGRVWWVGAPVWLWIDTDDSLAWGAHTVTASDPTLTVTATVWATHVTFTTGDGGSITCAGPGTPRAYDLNSLISEHSPSGCEHTYMSTSVLGDPASNYTVSATVTWRTDWTATNGESGAFTLTIPGANTPTIHVGELRVVTR